MLSVAVSSKNASRNGVVWRRIASIPPGAALMILSSMSVTFITCRTA